MQGSNSSAVQNVIESMESRVLSHLDLYETVVLNPPRRRLRSVSHPLSGAIPRSNRRAWTYLLIGVREGHLMILTLRLLGVSVSVFTLLVLTVPAPVAADGSPQQQPPPPASGKAEADSPESTEKIPTLNLLEAVRDGSVAVAAEGAATAA